MAPGRARASALLLAAAAAALLLAAARAADAEPAACQGGVCEAPASTAPAADEAKDLAGPPLDVHAFFYLWYGNPEHDGKWLHWDHAVIPHWNEALRSRYPHGERFRAPDECGAPFRPARGLYSSRDPHALAGQMAELKRAGVFVVSVSWWGRPGLAESVDGEGVPSDHVVPLVLDAAAAHGLRVNFHLEPYRGRSAESVRADLEYIFARYGAHPAFYRDPRRGGRHLFYVYDAYHTPAAQWARLLRADGDLSVRGGPLDADMVALLLEARDQEFVEEGAFDGFYTYFASSRFTFGADPDNWQQLATWAAAHNKLFVPSVGPGYDDTWIRPWNAANTVSRREGGYYDESFLRAVTLRPTPHAVSITSWNEWGEGTQIEPAVPYTSPGGRVSLDYAPHTPDHYLLRTAHWAAELRSRAPWPRNERGKG